MSILSGVLNTYLFEENLQTKLSLEEIQRFILSITVDPSLTYSRTPIKGFLMSSIMALSYLSRKVTRAPTTHFPTDIKMECFCSCKECWYVAWYSRQWRNHDFGGASVGCANRNDSRASSSFDHVSSPEGCRSWWLHARWQIWRLAPNFVCSFPSSG